MSTVTEAAALNRRQASVELARFVPAYLHQRSLAVRTAWFFIGAPLVRSSWIPSSGMRRILLRLFGARIGAGVVIKPGVRVKFPWLLEVGAHCWLGEDCWIDNLAPVTLAENVCVSQGAYFCTGSHDWSDPAFALRTAPISISAGAWICARAFVGPGVAVGEGAVVGAAAVATKDIPDWEVYAGNPAQFVRRRRIQKFHETQAGAGVSGPY